MKFCINCMAKIRDSKDVCPFCGQQQNEGVKSAFHMSPGITLSGGRYLLGKATGWDEFSVTYIGRDLMENKIISIQEYLPEALVRRQAGGVSVACFSQEQMKDYERGIRTFFETGQEMKMQAELLVNVSRVLDCFYENGTAYIVTEYLNGQTVEDLLREGHLFPWDSAKQVMDDVLEGIISLHSIGIYHQDLHPGSILLTADGQIKITVPGGFRYQLIGDKIQRSAVVRNGFSAEEQYRNRGEVVPATDVYAAGAVMFQMLTGVRPLSAAERVQEDTLAFPKDLQGQIPKNIQNAVMNSLLLLSRERTPTPARFKRQLSENKVERIEGQKRKKSRGRNRIAVTACAAALAVVLTGTAVASLLFGGGRKESSGQKTVPNVVGMSREKAEKALEKAGMQWEISDILPSDQELENIVSQKPRAGDALSGDQKVQLTMSGKDQTVRLFNLREKTEEEAVSELERRNLGCDSKQIYTEGEESNQIEEGCVAAVLLGDAKMTEEYKDIDQQSRVTLCISQGDYKEKVPLLEIPDLTGKTVEDVFEIVDGLKENNNGMTFDVTEEEKYDLDVEEGKVISQRPKAGKTERPIDINGTQRKITLDVSLGPPKARVPDVVGMSKDEAVEKLKGDDYLFRVTTQNRYSNDYSAGTVIYTDPASGKEVRMKDSVTVYVSIGSKPTPVYTPSVGGNSPNEQSSSSTEDNGGFGSEPANNP